MNDVHYLQKGYRMNDPTKASRVSLVDDDGENRAVRAFLALYGTTGAPTADDMAAHLRMSGFDVVPDWVKDSPGHLTKARAQEWLRMLFALEDAPGKRRGALERFKEYGGHEVTDPLERLRFFCSLAMTGRDWLDVEPLFDDVLAERAAHPAEPRGEPVALADEREAAWFSMVMNAAAELEDAANCLRDKDAEQKARNALRRYRNMADIIYAARHITRRSAPTVVQSCNHVLYRTEDADRPAEICDRNGEVVLAQCRLCGKAEAELNVPTVDQQLSVKCIGRGAGDGCGFAGGISGGVCPSCGGMLLSDAAAQQAKEIAADWMRESKEGGT